MPAASCQRTTDENDSSSAPGFWRKAWRPDNTDGLGIMEKRINMDRINLDWVLIDPTVNGYVVGFTRWRRMWRYNYTKRHEQCLYQILVGCRAIRCFKMGKPGKPNLLHSDRCSWTYGESFPCPSSPVSNSGSPWLGCARTNSLSPIWSKCSPKPSRDSTAVAERPSLRPSNVRTFPARPTPSTANCRGCPCPWPRRFSAASPPTCGPCSPLACTAALPAAWRSLAVVVLDGKKIKNAAKRLLFTRGLPGKLFGGKLLAAYLPAEGLVVALAAEADGEANDIPQVPRLLPLARAAIVGPRLWVADAQFCDLDRPALVTQEGDHMLLRFTLRNSFQADATKRPKTGVNRQGQAYRQDWGWMGSASIRGDATCVTSWWSDPAMSQ